MSRSFDVVWSFLRHYKYLIVIVVGVALVGFLDENSFLSRFKYEMQISDLKEQIRHYNEENDKATQQLREIKRHPQAIEKIARERYFMKADDEDVYVLSTDQMPNNTSNDSIE